MTDFLQILATIFQFFLSLLGDFACAFIDAFDKNESFNAQYGKAYQIGSPWNKGFPYGRHLRLSLKKSYENLLISGPTGSGKTSRYLCKAIFSLKNCSILINDPQRELVQLTAGYLSRSFRVLIINFADCLKSCCFNPLSRIKRESDIFKLADLLISIPFDKGSGDIYWKLASVNLTQVLIRILLLQPKVFHNLANLIRMLHYFSVEPEKVDRWVAESGDEKLIIDYKSIVATPEKTLQNVVASVKAALQLFDNPDIARTTSRDDIDFEDLRRTPTVIFLNNSLSDAKYISVLNSIFFDQFFAFALETVPKKSDLPIFNVLEECGTSLFIPSLPQATATCRKAKVGCLIAVQQHSQLKAFYGNHFETIKANCRTKIHLTGQTSMDELKELETLSGKCVYKDKNGVERTGPLITADAIRMLPINRNLIVSGHYKMIKGRSSPYYKSLVYNSYANLPFDNTFDSRAQEPIPMIK